MPPDSPSVWSDGEFGRYQVIDMAGPGRWRRSSACSDGNCVEVSVDADVVLVRSSVEPDVALPLTAEQWRSLLDAVKSDELVPEQEPERPIG